MSFRIPRSSSAKRSVVPTLPSIGLKQIDALRDQVSALRQFLQRLRQERQQSDAFDEEDVGLVVKQLQQAEQTLEELEDMNRRRQDLLNILEQRRTALIQADEDTRVFQHCPQLCEQFQAKEHALRQLIESQLPED